MKKTNLGYFQLIRWAWSLLLNVSRRYTISYIIAMLAQVVIEVTQLWVAALVITEIGQLATHSGNPERLIMLGIASVVLLTLDKIAWNLMSYYERQIYLFGSGGIYQQFNNKLAELSVSQHNSPKIRKLIDRLEYEGYAWKPLNFSFELLYASHAVARFLTSSVIIMTQLPFIVILLVVGALPVLFVQRTGGAKGWGIWNDVGDNSRIFWGVSDNLRRRDAIEEIIPQQSTGYLLKRAHSAIATYTEKSSGLRRKYALYQNFAGVFEMLMAGASYVWLIMRAISGSLSFNNFIFLSSLIWQTLSSVRLVVTSVARSLEDVPFMRDFISFMNLQNDLPMVENPKIVHQKPLTIHFENVSFKYPRKKAYSLQNITLSLQPGEHVALVGLNGAGKTTLIRLLLRFYDPTEGRILVDGIDLKEVDLESYYRHIGTLFQTFNKYPLEFKNNITLSNATDTERYNQSLKISGADSVLKTIANDQVFLQPEFENGTDLSGGQWQRVAIARNMYAASDVYILDEPTSAIDAITEQKIFDKLYAELDGKTLVTVSHRFNTVRRAEKIIVLEDGKIVEQGTHEALMKNSGLYYDMFTSQASGYSDANK